MFHWVHLYCANQEKSIWLWWFSNPVENCELYVFLPISIIRRIIAKVEAKQVHHCLLVALLWKRQHCITKVLYVLSANAKFLRKFKTVGMELHLANGTTFSNLPNIKKNLKKDGVREHVWKGIIHSLKVSRYQLFCEA